MDVKHERRSGDDRRQFFLLGLDRRQSSVCKTEQRLDAGVRKAEIANEESEISESGRFASGVYWGIGEEVPPVE